MDIRIRIDTAKQFDAPSLARWLLALNALHLAAALKSPIAPELHEQLSELRLVEHLASISTKVTDVDSRLIEAAAAIGAARIGYRLSPPVVQSIQIGSVDMVLEGIAESIWEHFRDLLAKVALVREERFGLEPIQLHAPVLAGYRNMFETVAIVGAMNAQVALHDMHATGLTVAAKQQARTSTSTSSSI